MDLDVEGSSPFTHPFLRRYHWLAIVIICRVFCGIFTTSRYATFSLFIIRRYQPGGIFYH